MINLITDQGCLMTQEEAEQLGVEVLPAPAGKLWSPAEETIRAAFLRHPGVQDECVYLASADGLTSSFDNAQAARREMANFQNIKVYNTRSFGPAQRYLIEKAADCLKKGYSAAIVISELRRSVAGRLIYLLPGRLDLLVAAGLLPSQASGWGKLYYHRTVLKSAEDGKTLEKLGGGHDLDKALAVVRRDLARQSIDPRLDNAYWCGTAAGDDLGIAGLKPAISPLDPALQDRLGADAQIIELIRK